MQYAEARQLTPGSPVRTDTGDVGQVLTTHDTGASVLVRLMRDDGRVLDVHGAHLWPVLGGARPAPEPDAAVRPGYYRVSWSVDLPKDEFPTPRDAAAHACELAGDCSGPLNVFRVVDGDDGTASEHDLAP